MENKDKIDLQKEIEHIFNSGANEIRIFEMIENFIDKRYIWNKNIIENNGILCGCGYGIPKLPYQNKELVLHILGSGSCCRKLAKGNLKPTNFRKENGIDVCDVNGYTITVFTLINQRIYAQHENGEWSLPKDEESINTIGDNW